MKKAFFAAIVLFNLTCEAQKNYEPTDTRKKNEGFARIPKGDIRNDLGTFTFSGIDEGVGKEELQKIPFTSFDASHMTFEGDGIKTTVSTSSFDASKHKLDYDEKYLIKIDRKTYYGGYGAIPKNYISSITLLIGKDTIAIPKAAYSDLYNLNLTYNDKGTKRSTNGIYRSKNGRNIYFYLFCKDDTGNYEVTFVFQNKQYLRRVLDYGFL